MDQTTTTAEEPSPQEHAGWSEKGIGRNWQHRFFHVLIRTLGTRPAYHWVYIVTFWYVLFRPTVRQRTRPYLQRRFPGRGRLGQFMDSWRLVWTFGKTLVDLTTLRVLGKGSITITSPDHDQLMQLGQSSSGFVLLNAHMGCWQIGISALGHLHKPISLVMIPDPKLEGFLRQYPLNIIDPRRGLEGVVEMMSVLRRGEILCLMGDRVFGEEQNIVNVSFLDSPVSLPVSPYRLASAAGVPVVVLMAPKTGRRAYELRLAKVIEVPPGVGRRPADYAPYAQQFAQCLDLFVATYPWQYCNFYDLWAKTVR